MQKAFHYITLLGVLAAGLSMPLHAREEKTANMSVEERLARMERMLSSQGMVDILLKLESLQTEIQRLRGEVEVQQHSIEELKKRQRDLYVDLDRRLLQIERNSPVAAATPPVKATGSQPAKTEAAAAAGAAAATTAASRKPAGKPTRSGRKVTGKPVKLAPVTESEQQAYQKAFDLLRELRYEQATTAFRNFLQKYPDGRYGHIAQYWLGEASYAQRKFAQAILDYQTLINKYPGSPKLAEAMLKIGYCQYELKDFDAAQQSLERLLRTYPGTTEAGQAQNLLQKIRLKRGK